MVYSLIWSIGDAMCFGCDSSHAVKVKTPCGANMAAYYCHETTAKNGRGLNKSEGYLASPQSLKILH